MADIDGGGLSFVSELDNSQIMAAADATLKRVQGMADGIVASGNTIDEMVADVTEQLGKIGAACEKQDSEINALEAQIEKLHQAANKEWDLHGWTKEFDAIRENKAALVGKLEVQKKLRKDLQEQSGVLENCRQKLLDEKAALESSEKSHVSLRQRMRELKLELVELEAAGKRNTDRYREVQTEVARLTDAWGDAQAQANILANDDAGFAGVMSGLTGLSGGFSAVVGTMALFGDESENLQQIMLKTQSVMAITNGLMQVSQMLNKDSAFMLGTVGKLKEWYNGLLTDEIARQAAANAAKQAETGATVENTTATNTNTASQQANAGATSQAAGAKTANTNATKVNTTEQGKNTTANVVQANSAKAGAKANIGLAGAFRMVGTAIKSIPVFGWIIAGITALIGLYAAFSSKSREAKKAQEEFSKALVEGCYKPIGKIEELASKWASLGDDLNAKKRFVEENQQAFAELGVSVRGVTDAENLLVANKDAFINAQKEKAKAMALADLAAQKEKEILEWKAQSAKYTSGQIKLTWHGFESASIDYFKKLRKLESERDSLFGQMQAATVQQYKSMTDAEILAADNYEAGTVAALEHLIQVKQTLLKQVTNNDDYKAGMEEIEELQKQLDAITGTTRKTGGGDGGTPKDPFLDKLNKRKAEYARFLKWVNSGDAILVNSAKQEFAGLLEQGATYIDYLQKQRDQILAVDVARRTKEQNKQLRTLNDQIAEETKRTVLESFNQELSEQLSNAQTVIEMLNIIERRRKELANDGTEIDNAKGQALDDAEKDARKQMKEQTESLLDEYAHYTDQRRKMEEQFNRDIELLNQARANATTDADREQIDRAIAERRKRYAKDTTGTGDADYDALLEQYTGFEQKKQAIQKKYDEQRRLAREHGDTEMLARISAAEHEELSKLSNEVLTQSADWQMLFGNLEGLTTSTIENLIKKIEQQKIQFSGDFNPADLQAINEQLEKARDEIEKRNPFKALNHAFKDLRQQMSDNKLLSGNDPFLQELKAKEAEYQQYQKWIQSGNKDLVQGSNDAFAGLLSKGGSYLEFLRNKKQELQGQIDMGVDVGNSMQIIDALIRKVESGTSAGDRMKEALKDVFSNVGETLSLVSGTFNAVVGGLEKMGVAMDEETEAILGDIGGILEGASQAAQGIASGNPLAVIQGSITLLSSAFDLFNSRDRKAEKSIKKHQEQIDILSNKYKQLEWQINKALGGEVYKNQQAAIKNMQAQQEHLYGMINDERSKKKTDQSKIRDYQEQIAELERSIADMQEEIANDILQTSAKDFASTLADSLVDAFAAGEDAAKAFEECVNDVLKNAIVNQLKKTFLEQQLQGALDQLQGSMGYWNGDEFIFDGLTDAEIAAFKNKVQAATNNFNQALGIYKDLFQDIMGDEDSDTSLTGAVKGVSEETASIVAGQMNAIRINQLEMKDLLRQQLLVLNQIATNTSFNKNLAKIDQIITILERNTGGDPLRAQGLA